MANINLTELQIIGSELFQDSESFLNELNDVDAIAGGSYYSGTYYSADVYVTAVFDPGKIYVGYLGKSYGYSGGYAGYEIYG
jgi:hypothetical protein